MKKHIVYIGVMTAALLIWAACNRVFDTKEQNLKIEYLSFTDHGCQGQESLGKTNSSAPYLLKHRMVGDTLILTIHHSANCCPAFVDSVSILDSTVDICIEDTLYGCRCMCVYENDFALLCPDITDTLRVRFGWIGEPFELDTLIKIDSKTVTYTFKTDVDSVRLESYPQWKVSRGALHLIGSDVVRVKQMIFPEPSLVPVSKEFVIAPGDSFAITIVNSLPGKPFGYALDGKQILLSRIDTLFQSSSLCTVRYRFKTTGYDKGYIAFAEQNGSDDTSISSESPGFLVGYTAGIENPLWVRFEKLGWVHDTEGFSTLSIRLEGKTNACRLKLETYGDGVIAAYEIPQNEDGSFEDEVSIAFSHVSGVYLENDTRLAVYGTVGYPKIIRLTSPLNE